MLDRLTLPKYSKSAVLLGVTIVWLLICIWYVFSSGVQAALISPIFWLIVLVLIPLLWFSTQYVLLEIRRRKRRAQTEILHTLVHEFKTPIAAIQMATDVLNSPIGRNHPERAEKYIRIIREESVRLQNQVDTMLSLARADRQTLVLKTEHIDYHDLIQSIAERHGDYLRLYLNAYSGQLIADRLHLTNVLHNLIDNAIKYSLGEPEISIFTRTTSQGLVVSILDKGVGIPKHLQNRIFQPFYRVTGSNQPSVKGTGLGLSYVQRIVQTHGWRINVFSGVGQGSEFQIVVPPSSVVLTNPLPASHPYAAQQSASWLPKFGALLTAYSRFRY